MMIKPIFFILACLSAGNIHAAKIKACPSTKVLASSTLAAIFQKENHYWVYGQGHYETKEQWFVAVYVGMNDVTSPAQAITVANQAIKSGLMLYQGPEKDTNKGVEYTLCTYFPRVSGEHVVIAMTPVPPMHTARFGLY